MRKRKKNIRQKGIQNVALKEDTKTGKTIENCFY